MAIWTAHLRVYAKTYGNIHECVDGIMHLIWKLLWVHSIEAECVKGLLELFRKCYSNSYPPLIHLDGGVCVVYIGIYKDML